MERDILALINKENHKFSKGQRMICRYISENYDKAAFMTAGKLGQTAFRNRRSSALLRSLGMTGTRVCGAPCRR